MQRILGLLRQAGELLELLERSCAARHTYSLANQLLLLWVFNDDLFATTIAIVCERTVLLLAACRRRQNEDVMKGKKFRQAS